MAPVERRTASWASDVEAVASAGGPTLPFTAGGALLVGDVVGVSATGGVVNKTAVAADGTKFVGVVVGGGGSFGGGYAFNDSASVGLALVASGKIAEVQVAGIAWVTAGAAITAGANVGFDTGTAGRVITNVTAGQKIGVALDTATVNGDKIRILIQPR